MAQRKALTQEEFPSLQIDPNLYALRYLHPSASARQNNDKEKEFSDRPSDVVPVMDFSRDRISDANVFFGMGLGQQYNRG